jgi:putative tryptophan/tyrosine transport system substrate-binding protein
MQRREFITLFGGAAATWPVVARAQQPAEMKRIALVDPSLKVGDMTVGGARAYRDFFKEMSHLGYVEGRNLTVERYSGEGRIDHYPELVRDIVSTHPDLIFAASLKLALQLKIATRTISIVALTADPIALGLVPSIARPGGNITGVSIDAGLEIWGKRLELLIEAVPKLSNVGYLVSQRSWEGPTGLAVREAASQAGISLMGELLGSSFNEQEYERVFNSIKRDGVDSLMISDEGEHIASIPTIVELAARTRIPTIYPYRVFVDAGGLISYSINFGETSPRIAGMIDQILRGTKPADIPFYQETKFELAMNLKTAKALGLELPATLVGRADVVIE